MIERDPVNLTPGLVRAIGRHGIYKTCSCGFILPTYTGRYPKHCPLCHAAVAEPEYADDNDGNVHKEIEATAT